MADVRLDSLPTHPSPIEPDSKLWVERLSGGSFVSEETEFKVTQIRNYKSQVDTYTAEAGDAIEPDNSSAGLTINLPASPNTGDTVYFKQVLDQPFSVNSLTIGRNTNTIMGLSEDLVVDTDNVIFFLRYTGTTWEIVDEGTMGTA